MFMRPTPSGFAGPARRTLHAALRTVTTLALTASLASPALLAQAAIDPNMAPRAAALERGGERQVATDMLGRYLATASDDGRAWFQLGRFYVLDARDWHRRGHVGDPDGQLYLDLAGVAFDQATRLLVDSADVYRSIAELDRALLFVEDSGWAAARERRPRNVTAPLPPYILELGVNLLNSCPTDGVLLTSGPLETVAVWYASLEAGVRKDILPLRPDLYATDSVYRRRMAGELGVSSALPVRAALAASSARRPLCMGPQADTAAAPGALAAPLRMVRVIGPVTGADEPLSLGELIKVTRQGGAPWARDVAAVYAAAARHNALLCGGLLLPLGDLLPRACGT